MPPLLDIPAPPTAIVVKPVDEADGDEDHARDAVLTYGPRGHMMDDAVVDPLPDEKLEVLLSDDEDPPEELEGVAFQRVKVYMHRPEWARGPGRQSRTRISDDITVLYLQYGTVQFSTVQYILVR